MFIRALRAARVRSSGRFSRSRVPRLAATPLRTEKRTCRVARISMAVPQVSESPWAKWASPAEKSPPLAYTGTYMRVPAESCLMSTLPAVSRGGTVRSASAAIAGSAGTASVGSGGSTKPPRSSAACSRAMVASGRRRSGASPMVRAHEGGAWNADAGQVLRGRPAPGDRPPHHERVGELVAQETEPRHLDRVAVADRLDLQDLDLQQVAGLGAVDVDRPGERVDHVQVGRRHGLQSGGRPHLAVERVTRLQDHLLTGVAAHDRRDIRVPAVVPGLRLLAERLRVVDPDLVRGHWGLLRARLERRSRIRGARCCGQRSPRVSDARHRYMTGALGLMMARGRPAVEGRGYDAGCRRRSSVSGSASRSGSSAARGRSASRARSVVSPERLIHTASRPSSAHGAMSWLRLAATWTWRSRSAPVCSKKYRQWPCAGL